jgi:hypothetical protein
MTIPLAFYGSPWHAGVRPARLPPAVPSRQRQPRLDRHVDPHVDARVDPHVDRPSARPPRGTVDGVLGAALMVAVAVLGVAMAGSEALRLAASL